VTSAVRLRVPNACRRRGYLQETNELTHVDGGKRSRPLVNFVTAFHEAFTVRYVGL
jgi:hypothetical protein